MPVHVNTSVGCPHLACTELWMTIGIASHWNSCSHLQMFKKQRLQVEGLTKSCQDLVSFLLHSSLWTILLCGGWNISCLREEVSHLCQHLFMLSPVSASDRVKHLQTSEQYYCYAMVAYFWWCSSTCKSWHYCMALVLRLLLQLHMSTISVHSYFCNILS